jgi:hypothetical protein
MDLNARAQMQMEQQMLQATKIIEEQIDNEIDKLDRLDNRSIEEIRKKRIEDMKQRAKDREVWVQNGHGKYYEIPSEKDFFEECKKSRNIVVHFYRDTTFRCKIVDKHLALLAPKHLECKFIKLNAEKSPFLTTRLNIRVIPSILILQEEKTKDLIVGFDDLGGTDDFSTEMLEWRIAQAEVIDYQGDLTRPPDQSSSSGSNKKSTASIMGYNRPKKNIRGKESDGDSSDDNDW